MRSTILGVLCFVVMGCATEPEPVASAQSEALIQQLYGLHLFHSETFDGNGRTCETCHAIPTFALSPAHVQARFAANPSGPLFRALDSDNYDGASYSLLRGDALARVHVVLAPNVTVDDVDGTEVQIRPDGRYVVTMRRATPTSVNSALQQNLMWDGREGTDLAHQAISAVFDHAEGTAPTPQEAAAIAAFQRTLFSSTQLASYAYGGPAPTLPLGTTESQRRGRKFFESGPISQVAGRHGLCATCHSGPMLNRTNEFNPGDPPGLAFAGNRTSEFNARGLEEHTYRITATADVLNDNPLLGVPVGTVMYPAGTVFTLTTSDPGALVVDTDPSDGSDGDADPCISTTGCFVVPGSTVVFHRIPTLWGIRHTAPYFHDNSATTLEDSARHYRGFFEPTKQSLLQQAAGLEARGLPGDAETAAYLRDVAGALTITDQDATDIAAYMRLL